MWKLRLVKRAMQCALSIAGGIGTVQAQTNDDLDRAAATARATADIARSRADAEKATAEAQKARLDVLKASLPKAPDVSRYKVEKPNAPALPAAAAQLSFEQAAELAGRIAKRLLPALKDVAIIRDDGRSLNMLELAASTQQALRSAEDSLNGLNRDAERLLAPAPDPQVGKGGAGPEPGSGNVASSAGGMVVAAVAETALAYLSALRTQHGFATTTETSVAEAVLTAQLFGALCAQTVCLDPDGAALLQESRLDDLVQRLKSDIRESRSKALELEAWSASRGERPVQREGSAARGGIAGAAPVPRTPAGQQAEVTSLIRELNNQAADSEKLIAALYAADAKGQTHFDKARRGWALMEAAKDMKSAVILSVRILSSDIDTVASDGLIGGLKVFMGGTTVAEWKMTDLKGRVVSTGAEMAALGRQRVPLSEH